MDLRESYHSAGTRHPWELARVKALRAIGEAYGGLPAEARILDLGCGDGFLIEALSPPSTVAIDAVDIHLTAEQVAAFSVARPRLNFHNSYDSLIAKGYGLLTMFDLLEHVEDDVGFLRETTSRFAAPGSLLFCTVPAFQTLFCSHDSFLKHHRRYSRRGLELVLGQAGLRLLGSGYLFGLLLPARALTVLAEKYFGAADTAPGIGHWRHGRFLTSMITSLLNGDNHLLLRLSRMGIKLPGLTVWALCEIPR